VRAIQYLRLKARALAAKLRGNTWREALRELEESPEAKARWEAAEKLAKAPLEPEVIKALVKALGDSHPFVRWKAGEALLAFKGEETFQALLEALRNRSPVHRAAVAEVLGKWGDARAVEPLCNALKSRNQLVRWSAAEALGKLRTQQALLCLLKAASDQAWGVRRAVALSIGKLPNALDGEGFNVLEALSRDPHPMVRSAAAKSLGRIRQSEAEQLLITLLGDESPQVRAEAARALGKIGSDQALNPLQSLVEDYEEALGTTVSKVAKKSMGAIRRRLLLAKLGGWRLRK